MKFMQIKPQKARGKLLESMWTDPEWIAEEKFDGDRRIAQFCGGVVRFTGTRESVGGTGFVEKSLNLPHLYYNPPKALEGTVLDGEIVAPFAKDLPGGKSKYVTSIMGSDHEKAAYLQKARGYLEYMVFDCLWYKGRDVRNLPLALRRPWAVEALKEWKNSYAKMVEQHANKKAACQEILYSGREGVILKHLSHTYGQENLWVKLKKSFTADVICMGFEPGKGKYKGQVGAIVFGQWCEVENELAVAELRRMGTASGFTDDQRRKLSKKDIGRVFRIKHNGREPTGAFRHPRFDCWRDDKDHKDCVYREDET